MKITAESQICALISWCFKVANSIVVGLLAGLRLFYDFTFVILSMGQLFCYNSCNGCSDELTSLKNILL